jgi:DNA-directed RNA polymerase subunit beta'
MLKTTLGQLLINNALPADMRDYNRVLTKKNVTALATDLAKKYPDKYREVMKDLQDIGSETGYTTGGLSVGLDSVSATLAARKKQQEIKQQLRSVLANRNLSDKQRNMKILEITSQAQKELIDAVYDEAKEQDNPLFHQVYSGVKGNKFQLNSLIGSDMQYVDHRNDPIPIPVIHGYGQGLRPVEYFAGAFGTRKGLIDLKTATSDAGFFAKQLTQMNHRLLVTADDDDDEEKNKEADLRGFPSDIDDVDNEGALLARGVGPYKRNTILTPKILKDLKNMNIKDILVRSPIVGGPADGGVFSRDVGIREKNRLPPIGDYVGIAAAQALAEPVTQSQISSKHSGGVGGAGAIAGFKALNALVQVPEKYPNGATHAQLDGIVQEIRAAPQGGHYVIINSQEHYVPTDMPLIVKRGDELEAGDVISEGMPSPGEIVKHKGVGEGRRYFVGAMRQVLQNSGISAHRRNIELLARGLINHVRLTDEHGDYVPDDVIPYSILERDWRPRGGSVHGAPKSLTGHYLERPVLHYSIGTKIGKSVINNLDKYGIKTIEAHKEPPPFQPEMIRGMANVATDPDWMTRMMGSYQQKSLLNATHRAAVSDTSGSSFVPTLARGETFALSGPTGGWKPETQNSGSQSQIRVN